MADVLAAGDVLADALVAGAAFGCFLLVLVGLGVVADLFDRLSGGR